MCCLIVWGKHSLIVFLPSAYIHTHTSFYIYIYAYMLACCHYKFYIYRYMCISTWNQMIMMSRFSCWIYIYIIYIFIYWYISIKAKHWTKKNRFSIANCYTPFKLTSMWKTNGFYQEHWAMFLGKRWMFHVFSLKFTGMTTMKQWDTPPVN